MAHIQKIFCKICGGPIYRSTSRINENLKLGHNFYCSRKCEGKYKTKQKIIKCENCGKELKRCLTAVSSHNFCSRSCAVSVNNKKRIRNAKKIKCKSCGKIFKAWLTGTKKYCSMECFAKENVYSAEDLLKIIKDNAKRLERVPAKREISEGISKACIRIFGSWNKAVSAAGFIPNRSHDDRMYKRAIAKANDGHVCDSVSELLIDNWLYKNNVPHEKNVPYPKTNHKADWAILSGDNKIFVEYFGLANDSPRYDRSVKEKRTLCKKQNIPLIAIYPENLYPKDNLDNNLKRKFGKYLSI